jgi:hypothetical protein
MNFKYFYLTESLNEKDKNVKSLKNIMAGFLQKDPSTVLKRDKGLVIKFSPVGSWTTFVNYLKNDLPGYNFVDGKSDENQLAFKSNKLFFWARQVGKDGFIYVTDVKNPKEPDWGENVEPGTTEPTEPETPPEEVPVEPPVEEPVG